MQSKERIVRYIERYVGSVSAVLIVAQYDGTVDLMISSLITIIPKALVNNTSFVLTTIGRAAFWVPFKAVVPAALENAPRFFFNGAMPKTVVGVYPVSGMAKPEQGSLEMLVDLFDWLYDLEPQPGTEIARLHDIYQNIEAMTTNILNLWAQGAGEGTRAEIGRLMIALEKHLTVSLSPYSHLAFEFMLVGCRTWMLSPTSRRSSTYPT